MRFLTIIADWANDHPGQAIGAFVGFLTGLLILVFGLAKTLLVAVLVFFGFLAGSLLDNNIAVMDKLKGIFKSKKKD